MTTRTIIAESMQQAMKQAKKELGDAAIILHSERFGEHIEVTVTDDMSCLKRHAEERAAKKAEAKRAEEARKAKEIEALLSEKQNTQESSPILSEEQKAILMAQTVKKLADPDQATSPSKNIEGDALTFKQTLASASALNQKASEEPEDSNRTESTKKNGEKSSLGFDWNKLSAVFPKSYSDVERREVKPKVIKKDSSESREAEATTSKKKKKKASSTSKRIESAAKKLAKSGKQKKASTPIDANGKKIKNAKGSVDKTPTCNIKIEPLDEAHGAVPVCIDSSSMVAEPKHGEEKEPALKRMMGDLKSIGEYWDSFGIYWDRYAEAYQYPWSKELRERLNYLHLSEDLRESLIRQYREIPEVPDAWQLILAELSRSIEISRYDMIRDGGAYAFVGPAGAGKTTTIGKIAAEYVLRHGAEKVGLISTDIFRIASYEQLLTIGRILDVDVEIVDAQQGGLQKALNKFSDKSLVLVDTAGLRRHDRDLAQQLAEIRKQGERLQSMLVLPANLQYESMQACYENYRSTNFKGCIFTKLDECTTLGSAVSMAVTTETPVAYLASGHTIPDDLVRATSPIIIEQLLSFACQERDINLMDRSSVADAINLDDEQQLQLI